MIETIIDTSITRKLYYFYDLDIDGTVQNIDTIKTLWFEYPRVDFLTPLFMEFIKNINSQYIYMTDGANIKEDECFLRFSKESFIKFIKTNETYVSNRGFKHVINDYYIIGITIFDETLEWLIHKNPDEGDITFSYQIEKIKNIKVIEKLKESEWFFG